jgi:threonine dehydrogenase-like Zn-dependent dehydrogenase
VKAAFKAGKERFEIRETALPEIGPRDCLVRVHYCAICVWCYKEWLRDGSDDLYGPGLTGHEIAGVVEKTGGEVKKWRPGDKVLTYFSGHCETCPECVAGKTTYCRTPGRPKNVLNGYAEYVAAAEQCLLSAPEGMDLKEACIIPDMVGTPMHAIRRAFAAGVARDAVAVWGLGPVGLFAIQGLRTFEDVKRIIALDPVESRRDLALNLGADEAWDPCEEGTKEKLRGENGGAGINYAFNCALASPKMAYETLALDGYLMNITGGFETENQCEKRVDGSFYFFKHEHDENMPIVLDGRIKLAPAISHEFPLGEINAAMELRAKQPEKSLKVVIRCG